MHLQSLKFWDECGERWCRGSPEPPRGLHRRAPGSQEEHRAEMVPACCLRTHCPEGLFTGTRAPIYPNILPSGSLSTASLRHCSGRGDPPATERVGSSHWAGALHSKVGMSMGSSPWDLKFSVSWRFPKRGIYTLGSRRDAFR